MAKKEENKYKYPSRFGSHMSMVNVDGTASLRASGNTEDVICTDEYGDYITKTTGINYVEYDSSNPEMNNEDEDNNDSDRELDEAINNIRASLPSTGLN